MTNPIESTKPTPFRRIIDERRTQGLRGTARKSLVLSLVVGVASLLMMAPAAQADLMDKKLEKLSCIGVPTPGTFNIFLVKRAPLGAPPAVCDPASAVAVACTTPVTVALGDVCDTVDAQIATKSTLANGIASTQCKTALGCAAAGSLLLASAPPVVPAGQLHLSELCIGTFLPNNQPFFDVCMTDIGSGVTTKVDAGATVTVAGLQYSQLSKIKQKTPALPAVAVVLLALGLASGGLLLKRRRQSIV